MDSRFSQQKNNIMVYFSGENCHRGAALGALLGAAAGHRGNELTPELKRNLGSLKQGLTGITEQMKSAAAM